MAVPTDLVNIALARVGATRISSLQNDTHNEARIARDIYDEARRDLLNLHTWNFAIKRAELTKSATAPPFGWEYAFPLPDDLVRVISVHPGESEQSIVEYRLEHQDGDDRVLVTNADKIFLRYVWDVEDVNLMSAAFRDCLAWRLARDFATALSKSMSAAELAEQAFQRKLSRSKAIDGIEDWPEKMADGSWITERFRESRN